MIVDFKVEGFDNNQTFYTDSNGLQMQKRVLNYRPTWDMEKSYADSRENVTANYYPVNTAISMRDLAQEKVFTVMNDRAQAGSALSKGSIQLMQNRRHSMYNDDKRGMGEPLNETDAHGNGIRVRAEYHLEVYSQKDRMAKQRTLQLRSDSPPQYFFTFNLTEG